MSERDLEFDLENEELEVSELGMLSETLPSVQDQDPERFLKLAVRENIIESNLADMPIFSFRRPVRKEFDVDGSVGVTHIVESSNNVVKYEWSDATGNHRAIEVVGSTRHGVPQFSDLEVLLAVTKAHTKNENKFPMRNDEYEFPNKFYYTNAEVARILGYQTITGPIIARIETAIQRMAETTLYNSYSGGMWDAKNKQYASDMRVAYHIVESFFSHDYREIKAKGEKRENYREMKNFIVLNNFFYESMCKKYFKIIDYDLFLGFKHTLTKRIYLILHKWGNRKAFMRIKYDTLYARIPLDENLERHRKKQMVKKSLQELHEVGYIKTIDYFENYMEIYLSHTYSLLEEKIATFEELKRKLLDYYELTELDLAGLFDDMELREGEPLVYLNALIDYCDYQVKKGIITNKRNYIIRGLVERYNIPRRFYKNPMGKNKPTKFIEMLGNSNELEDAFEELGNDDLN